MSNDTEAFDADLKQMIQSIERDNHSDEDFVNELGRIIGVFRRNARKNSTGMRDAVAQVLRGSQAIPTNGHGSSNYAANGVGGDPFEAIDNMARQGIN